MTEQEFKARHHARYRKVLLRQMTLAEALRENEIDWRALRAAGGAYR